MLKLSIISFRSLVVLSLLTGFIYPLVVMAFGQFLFPHSASGSLLYDNNNLLGSTLIAQKFESPRYFHSRPSAADFATVPSGASNLGPTSAALKDALVQRQKSLGMQASSDLLTTSASGLDPHLTPDGAYFQIDRISEARALTSEQKLQLRNMVKDHVENPLLGFLGMPMVNVLQLNIELDKKFR